MRHIGGLDPRLLAIGLFFLFALVTYFGALFISRILHLKKSEGDKLIAYECGEKPSGEATVAINNRFYILALLFLVFEAEILLLAPVLTLFRPDTSFVGPGLLLMAVFVFVGVLSWGFFYCWYRGDLDWVSSKRK